MFSLVITICQKAASYGLFLKYAITCRKNYGWIMFDVAQYLPIEKIFVFFVQISYLTIFLIHLDMIKLCCCEMFGK